MTPSGPLLGTTVLDLTRVLSGPYCTMFLADMGARVIKIERPGSGDDTRAWGPPFLSGESAYFLGINRNKESVTLDISHPDGRRVLERLLDRTDVLVENFRPGALAKYGLDYTSLHASQPRLVYASISGFGQTGPRREEAGYDAVVQAQGGMMAVTGDADGPPYRVGTAIADLVAGLLAAQGILLALLARVRTGQGQQVDVAMYDGLVALLTHHASIYLSTGQATARVGNRHLLIAPYDMFLAADGEFFLAVGNDAQFRRFCDVAGLDLGEDARFATNPGRVAHEPALRALIDPVLRARARSDWLEALTSAGVPCGAVRSVPEALDDPQLRERDMIETVVHATLGQLKVLGVPIKLSETPGRVASAPPTLGQHTAQVLGELGLDVRAIAGLRASGAI